LENGKKGENQSERTANVYRTERLASRLPFDFAATSEKFGDFLNNLN
jgi:hypothetical protein